MNLKITLYIIVGAVIFFSAWIYSMLIGISLLIGFGFGVLLHNYVTNIFKNWQKNIYLSEKADMQHKKQELKAELEKLEKEFKDVN